MILRYLNFSGAVKCWNEWMDGWTNVTTLRPSLHRASISPVNLSPSVLLHLIETKWEAAGST